MSPSAISALLARFGHLGWVPPSRRTNAQQAAHTLAHRGVIQHHGLPIPAVPMGVTVALYALWKHPDVVADVGFSFDRIHQLTGSCVWAGGTNALFTTIASQRVAAANPTKAFLPFTLHNYAMSRHAFGDDGEGEGSLGSTFAKSLTDDGVCEWKPGTSKMPSFTDSDGVSVTSRDELHWSSYRNSDLQAILAMAKANKLGGAAVCRSSQDVKAMGLNGYGTSFACNNYIGNASVQGTGDKARVIGRWNGSGGHQQYVFGYEENPDFGPLYAVGNNWPGSTYPRDPGGLPICSCWVKEADVDAAFRLDAEVYGLSNLPWFPATPKILDQFV